MKRRGILEDKKAALELSIGTMVIIVLAVSMLILGLVLVRNIFGVANNSVNDLEKQTRDQIAALFTKEKGGIVLFNADSNNVIRIRPSDESFYLAMGAQTFDGTSVGSFDRLQYTVSLKESGDIDCIKQIGEEVTKGLFITQLDVNQDMDEYDNGANAFARIQIRVPEGTGRCTQKVTLSVVDNNFQKSIGGTTFTVDILRESLF